MVSTLHQNLTIPVTCKIRLLDDEEDTLRLAKLLQVVVDYYLMLLV